MLPLWLATIAAVWGEPVRPPIAIRADLSAAEAARQIAEDGNFDEASLDPEWALSRLSDDYVERIMHAIVAFEMLLDSRRR